MLRLRRFAGRLFSITMFVVVASIIASGPLLADDADTAPEKPADPSITEAEPEDALAVPEGTDPKTLHNYLNLLARTPAAERTPAGFRAHFSNLYALAEEVLGRDVDDETSLHAIGIMTGSLELMEQFGDQTAGEHRHQLIEQLKQSRRPAIASYSRILDVEGKIKRLSSDDRAALKDVIEQVVQLLQDQPLTMDHARVAYQVMSVLERSGDPKLVSSAARTFAKHLRTSEDTDISGLADTFEGTARLLNLKGNPLEITGTTISGDDFNIGQWKGKVVIVDFWATWCGPCIAEMPALLQLYETHHKNGLEIVGISLDDKRFQLEGFLDQRQIPWPTIFIDPEGKEAWDNPIATYYGVSQLPTMFLVGRDGKVVATDLFGPTLHEAVDKLMAKE